MSVLDLADIVDGLQDCKEIYWAKCNSNEAEDEKSLAKELIERAGVMAEECNKVFLNYNGDFSLIQINDVTESVSEIINDDADIYLSASVDWEMEDAYDVVALFVV